MEIVRNFQELENIAIAPWYSNTLFFAVENGVFDLLLEGKTEDELCEILGVTKDAVQRFLRILQNMGLVNIEGEHISNTEVALVYLTKSSYYYQGNSILWRKNLINSWNRLGDGMEVGGRVVFPEDCSKEGIKERFLHYSLAMDDISKCKAAEIEALCKNMKTGNRILDLGSGLGAISRCFLKKNPKATSTFVDMSDVLEIAEEVLSKEEKKQIRFCPMDILQEWRPLRGEEFSLIIMSNIVHAFDAADNTALLFRVYEHLSPDGIVLIHDFFHDHMPMKAGIMDMNMMINTFNGKVFSFREVERFLHDSRIPYVKELSLSSDTALILASKNKEALERIGK